MFIIGFWSLVGLTSGCVSGPSYSLPQSGTKDHSEPSSTLPYRVDGRVYYPLRDASGFVQSGTASWYGPNFHGKQTSNGETYNMNLLTAAHKTLPFNSMVRVTHQITGKQVIVRINDRGPFVGDRVIDLSRKAAQKLGMIEKGTAPVDLKVFNEKPFQQAGRNREKSSDQQLYAIQIGVFSDQGNARRASQRIPNSYTLKYEHEGQTLYKVVTGKYYNYEKALVDMDRLRDQGFNKSFITLIH